MGRHELAVASHDGAVAIDEKHRVVERVRKQYKDGIITDGERLSKTIAIWTEVTEELSNKLYERLSEVDELHRRNPLYLAVDSGARGNRLAEDAEDLGEPVALRLPWPQRVHWCGSTHPSEQRCPRSLASAPGPSRARCSGQAAVEPSTQIQS